MVDSGSTDMVLPGINLPYYNPAKNFYDTTSKTPILTGVKERYADGSWWIGNFYQDQVSLGKLNFQAIFAVMTNQVMLTWAQIEYC